MSQSTYYIKCLKAKATTSAARPLPSITTAGVPFDIASTIVLIVFGPPSRHRITTGTPRIPATTIKIVFQI